MSRRSPDLLLADIMERVERIERHVAGMDLKAFLKDEKTIDAVVRNLEVIGEAANRMPLAFRTEHAEVPWRRIVGLRNRVIHAYFEVDLELVWEIVCNELPTLKSQVRGVVPERADESTAEPHRGKNGGESAV